MKQSKKGGFFFSSVKNDIDDCNVNKLSELSKNANSMRENYKKCCPKNIFKMKNKSAYCRQLEKNFNSLKSYNRDLEGYYGDETDVSKIKNLMNKGGTKRRNTKMRKTKKRKRRYC
jgi:hypothetical protein